MNIRYLESIANISLADWNYVVGDSYPFLRHEFLSALELSESACARTGWIPQHIVVTQGDDIVAVMPLYLKDHSYGEYVFDWIWADAYQRHGLSYYPKLLSAIPFTPATGPRVAMVDSVDKDVLYDLLSQSLQEKAVQYQVSSIHILLPEGEESRYWHDQGLQQRCSVQYHWFNQSYNCFDDFLESFTSRKRKNLKKERRRVIDQGISMEVFCGREISTELWDTFYNFYQLTYAKRSGHGGYLRRDFFSYISETMPEAALLILAKHENKYVAGALYFFSKTTLYGRYWGCTHEFDMLHFETCYYQGIEFCIAQGLQKFDPGAQGEHKIQRGFKPSETWSNHWIAHPQFRQAINDYIHQEALSNAKYIKQSSDYLPFKKN